MDNLSSFQLCRFTSNIYNCKKHMHNAWSRCCNQLWLVAHLGHLYYFGGMLFSRIVFWNDWNSNLDCRKKNTIEPKGHLGSFHHDTTIMLNMDIKAFHLWNSTFHSHIFLYVKCAFSCHKNGYIDRCQILLTIVRRIIKCKSFLLTRLMGSGP